METSVPKLGRFIRVRRRENGTDHVFMSVPSDQRPADWPPTIALPQIGKREGSISDPKFLARVTRDAEALNKRLNERLDREASLAKASDYSVTALAAIYRDTVRFRMKTGPARAYRNSLWTDRIAQWAESRGLTDFRAIKKPDVEDFLKLYDDRPFAQLDARSVWNILCREAVAVGWRSDNPTSGIPWTEPESAEHDLWTPEDVARYRATADRRRERVMGVYIEVNMFAGQRVNDLLQCRYGVNYRGGTLALRQGKGGRRVVFPLPANLRELLASIHVPGCEFLFPDPETGGRFKLAHFQERFRQLRHAVSADDDKLLQLMHLRHSAVCNMARNNLNNFQIASITGHDYADIDKILEHYAVDRPGFARSGAMKLNAAMGGTDDDFLPPVSEGLLDDSTTKRKYKRPGPPLGSIHITKAEYEDALAWVEAADQ